VKVGTNLSGNSQTTLARRPAHGSSAEQMQVEVIDGLAAVRAGVDDDAIAAVEPGGACDFGSLGKQVATAATTAQALPPPATRCAAGERSADGSAPGA